MLRSASLEMGLVWQAAGPHVSLAATLTRAVELFQQRYGEAPTVCFVHPSMLPVGAEAQSAAAAGLRLVTTRALRAGCYWLGVSYDPAQAEEATIP